MESVTAPTPTPILIVDGDDEFRSWVARLLTPLGRPVAEARTGEAGLEAAHSRNPCAVILEVHLGGISGYEVCRELRERFGDLLPIVFVSAERTEAYDRVSGLLLGADDYLAKPLFPDELLARMRRLLVRATAHEREPRSNLTMREREVLGLLAAGRRQAEIASQLFISEKTVATHIQHILRKIGAHSRAEAVAFAHRIGLSR